MTSSSLLSSSRFFFPSPYIAVPTTGPAQNQSLLSQALAVPVEQGGDGLGNEIRGLGTWDGSLYRLVSWSCLGLGREGGTQPRPPLCLPPGSSNIAWLARGVSGSRASSLLMLTLITWERGWEEPRILHSHHIIHSLPQPLVGGARHLPGWDAEIASRV